MLTPYICKHKILIVAIAADILHMLEEDEFILSVIHPPLPPPPRHREEEEGDKEQSDVLLMDSHLEDVLMMAKTIREKEPASRRKLQEKQKRQKEEDSKSVGRKVNSTPMSLGAMVDRKKTVAGRREGTGASKLAEREQSPLPPPAALRSEGAGGVSGPAPSRTEMAPMHSSAETLLAMQLPHPVKVLLPSRALLMQQAQFLAQLQCGPVFPPSALCSAVMRHLASSPSRNMLCQLTAEQCAAYLRRVRGKFEKTLRLKLNRLGTDEVAHAVSDGEALELCVWWWNVHRCALVHESAVAVAVDDVDTSPVEGEANQGSVRNEACGRAVHGKKSGSAGRPVAAGPLEHVWRHRPESALPQDVLRLQALARDLVTRAPLYLSHHQLDTRVLYAVETVLSKLLLPSVLHAMKECVVATSSVVAAGRHAGSGSSTAALDERWVAALQLYQAAYQLLAVDEAPQAQPHHRRKKKVAFFKKDIRMI